MRIVRRPKVTVTVGEPFQVGRSKKPSGQQGEELSARIMSEIAAMLPEEYGGSAVSAEDVVATDG